MVSWDRRRRRRPALDETVRVAPGEVVLRAVSIEVGFLLVRESPMVSWTRVAWMTHIGAEGRLCPGSVGPCTKCAADRFFSRRAAGGVTTGLQMSYIGFRS